MHSIRDLHAISFDTLSKIGSEPSSALKLELDGKVYVIRLHEQHGLTVKRDKQSERGVHLFRPILDLLTRVWCGTQASRLQRQLTLRADGLKEIYEQKQALGKLAALPIPARYPKLVEKYGEWQEHLNQAIATLDRQLSAQAAHAPGLPAGAADQLMEFHRLAERACAAAAEADPQLDGDGEFWLRDAFAERAVRQHQCIDDYFGRYAFDGAMPDATPLERILADRGKLAADLKPDAAAHRHYLGLQQAFLRLIVKPDPHPWELDFFLRYQDWCSAMRDPSCDFIAIKKAQIVASCTYQEIAPFHQLQRKFDDIQSGMKTHGRSKQQFKGALHYYPPRVQWLQNSLREGLDGSNRLMTLESMTALMTEFAAAVHDSDIERAAHQKTLRWGQSTARYAIDDRKVAQAEAEERRNKFTAMVTLFREVCALYLENLAKLSALKDRLDKVDAKTRKMLLIAIKLHGEAKTLGGR